MHEFSVMSELVASIRDEAEKRNAVKVSRVVIELGEFTLLGEEQMRFCFDVLAKGTALEGAELVFRKLDGVIECRCGYRGKVASTDDLPHSSVPILECPECAGAATIVSGRECVIRDISMVVPDV